MAKCVFLGQVVGSYFAHSWFQLPFIADLSASRRPARTPAAHQRRQSASIERAGMPSRERQL